MDATPLIGLVIVPLICVIWLLYMWSRPERRQAQPGARRRWRRNVLGAMTRRER